MALDTHTAGDRRAAGDGRWLPSPHAVAAGLRVDLDRWPLVRGLAGLADAWRAIDDLVATHFIRSFARMGWRPAAGCTFTVSGLAAELGIVAQHQRLLARMVDVLREDGWVTARGGSWHVNRAFDAGDPDDARVQIAAAQPWAENELALIARCAEALPDVLRGRIDPLRILFPRGSTGTLEEFYALSPTCVAADAVVAEAVAAIARSVPRDMRLSILEAGAGTCATTRHVLARVGEFGAADYCVTDISPFFVSKAKQTLGQVPGVRCAMLDIERDPDRQGFGGARFHVVVAANVLHATARLRESLRHMERLLFPGGLLIIREAIGRQRVLDSIFGLLGGWWRFADAELRPDYPLLTRGQWLELLDASGFDRAVPLGGIEEYPVLQARQIVALAQRS